MMPNDSNNGPSQLLTNTEPINTTTSTTSGVGNYMSFKNRLLSRFVFSYEAINNGSAYSI